MMPANPAAAARRFASLVARATERADREEREHFAQLRPQKSTPPRASRLRRSHVKRLRRGSTFVLGLVAALLLPFSSPAHAAVAFVQDDWDGASDSSTTLTYASGLTVTTGNAIVIAVRWDGAAITASVSDDFSNTYTSATGPLTDSSTTFRLQVFCAKNITGGANYTPTVTFSSAATNRAIAFHEVSGVDTGTCVDVGAINAQEGVEGTDALTSGANTTTVNGAYIFGALTGSSIASGATEAGTGFTLRANATTSCCGHPTIATESQTQTSAGSIAATFTHPAGGAIQWITAMVALKPAGAAPACRPGSLSMLGVGC